MSDLERTLERAGQGDSQAARDLLPLVYDELRRFAASKLGPGAYCETLQPTALVHEAWIKLNRSGREHWESRSHFFRAAAEAMRHIMIDRVRKKHTQRHGAGLVRVDVDAVELAAPAADDVLLAVNAALEEFELFDGAKAEIVKLRFFAGLSEKETAELLGVSERTVVRHWAYAQAWLFERIQQRQSDG